MKNTWKMLENSGGISNNRGTYIFYIASVCENNEGYSKLLPRRRPEIIQVIQPFWRDLE